MATIIMTEKSEGLKAIEAYRMKDVSASKNVRDVEPEEVLTVDKWCKLEFPGEDGEEATTMLVFESDGKLYRSSSRIFQDNLAELMEAFREEELPVKFTCTHKNLANGKGYVVIPSPVM